MSQLRYHGLDNNYHYLYYQITPDNSDSDRQWQVLIHARNVQNHKSSH